VCGVRGLRTGREDTLRTCRSLRAIGAAWSGCAATSCDGATGALALGRLERLPDGRVFLGFKRAWSDGTSGIELSTQEFTEKLAAIIPPPRANQTLYAGVLAGNAALRAEVVPRVGTSTEAQRAARAALKRVKAEDRRETSARAEERRCWAELLKRVFEVDGWACPHCDKPMALRTIVIREPATTQVVSGLLRATGPPVAA